MGKIKLEYIYIYIAYSGVDHIAKPSLK